MKENFESKWRKFYKNLQVQIQSQYNKALSQKKRAHCSKLQTLEEFFKNNDSIYDWVLIIMNMYD
jgi:hypothetical protein